MPLSSQTNLQTNLLSLSGPSGVYKPGSVLKYSCEVSLHHLAGLLVPSQPGSVVVPVLASTRVCRKGKWDGQVGCFCTSLKLSQTNFQHL